MSRELFELSCRDLQGLCEFAAQAQNLDALMQAVARHATEHHGMHSFPPQWWVQMRHQVRTVSDGRVELCCKDVRMVCEFTARAETREELMRTYGRHAQERHGWWPLPSDLESELEQRVRAIQG